MRKNEIRNPLKSQIWNHVSGRNEAGEQWHAFDSDLKGFDTAVCLHLDFSHDRDQEHVGGGGN